MSRSANSNLLRRDIETLEDRATPSATAAAVARNDWADTDGSNPVAVAVLANDSPSQATAMGKVVKVLPSTVVVKHGPAHGTVTLNPQKGTLIYRAAADFTGTDTFRYAVTDSRGAVSNIATVSVRVNRPTAADDWVDTDASNPVAISVLDNDTDPDGNEHIQFPGSVALRAAPLNGTVTLDRATNTFTYQAKAGFTGTDSFSYVVTDDAGATSERARVYVQVNRPTAANDIATFDGTAPVAINVLDNDTDPDGNQHILPGSVSITAAPLHGTATVNPVTGVVTYQANPGFNGTDTFKYTIADDAGAVSVPGTVTVVGAASIKVTGDVIDTDGTNPVTISVLDNDTGVGAMVPRSVAITMPPANGSVTVNPTTGAITYTARGNFSGTDTFKYSARDTAGNVGTATVSVRVNRPVATDDWIDTDGTNSVAISVLDNDSDPDGNSHIQYPASVTKVTNPLHGTVSFDPLTNSFTYTAAGNFAGTDSFQYIVTDDAGAASLPAHVFIRVNRPVAGDDSATAHGTNPVTISVLGNDTDPDGNEHIQFPGSVSQTSNPAHGTVTFDAATNSFTYTAAAGFKGTDSFQYVVTDDAGAASLPATVLINVEVPTVANSTLFLSGSTAVVSVPKFASHPEGLAAITGPIVVDTPPQHGQVSIDQVHLLITYTVTPGYLGSDSFTYHVTDAFGAISSPATVSVTRVNQVTV